MPTVILNQLQIFTEHSKTKITMRVNTKVLEAQGTRFIKKGEDTGVLTWGSLILEHWKCFDNTKLKMNIKVYDY